MVFRIFYRTISAHVANFITPYLTELKHYVSDIKMYAYNVVDNVETVIIGSFISFANYMNGNIAENALMQNNEK